MNMTTLTEACGCGATFTVTAPNTGAANQAAAEWREGHKHAESVGICGNAPEVAGFPDHLPRPICVLKAGHAGAHGDGDGAHWLERPQNGSETAPGAPNRPRRVSATTETPPTRQRSDK